MSFRTLIDFADEHARKELGDYYIVNKNRMDNFILCLETGAKRINELTKIISDQQEEIRKLNAELTEVTNG